MNANIEGLLNYYKNKSMHRMIVSDNGYYLTDKEAKAYLTWCLENGHEDLHHAPDFFEVKDCLKLI